MLSVFLNAYALKQSYYSFPWWFIFYLSLVEFSTGTSSFWHFEPSVGNNDIYLQKKIMIEIQNLKKQCIRYYVPSSRNSPELCHRDLLLFWFLVNMAGRQLQSSWPDQLSLCLQIDVSYLLLPDTLHET